MLEAEALDIIEEFITGSRPAGISDEADVPVAGQLDPTGTGNQLGECDGSVPFKDGIAAAMDDQRWRRDHGENATYVVVEVHGHEGAGHPRGHRVPLELGETLDVCFARDSHEQ